MESKDVRVVEIIEPGRPGTTDNCLIQIEPSDENVIFDVTVHGARPPTEESEIVSNMPETVYERRESEPLAEVNLEDPTYYPSGRRSERRPAVIPPDRFNYDEMHMVTELKEERNVSESYEIAVISNDRAV